MSTYQRSNSGARRPFGSVNANTLRGSLSKSSGSANSDAVKPVKEKKSLLSRRGIFTSILTKKAGKTERSGKDETLQLESPTKKARVDVDVLEKPASRSDDRDGIFRRSSHLSREDVDNFWTEEMEEMLSLKPANGINESRDDESLDVEVGDLEERDGCDFYEQVQDALEKELGADDTGSSGRTRLLTSGPLREHETDGFDLGSPSKKARVEEPPASETTANDYDAIFRPSSYFKDENSRTFWTEEMQEVLSLRPARAINDNCDEVDTSLDVQVGESKEHVRSDFYEQVRSALVKELSVDDTSSAEHVLPLSSGHMKEDETNGIQIAFSD